MAIRPMPPAGWPSFLPAGGLTLFSLLACLWLQARPPGGGRPVALVFPPWWSPARVFLAASQVGAVVRLGGMPGIVVVVPATAGNGVPPDASGAWLVLNPQAVGACGAPPGATRNE